MHQNILELIKAIRESFDESVAVYTQGSCYRFYEILKRVYPDAVAYYDMDHIITKIGDKFYDINGEYTDTNRFLPLEYYPQIIEQAKEWKYNK